MREIRIPDGVKPIDEFAFVKILVNGQWEPALLNAWYRLPDGWACLVRTPMHKAVAGRVTHGRIIAYDPAVIRKISFEDLNGGAHHPAFRPPATH